MIDIRDGYTIKRYPVFKIAFLNRFLMNKKAVLLTAFWVIY